MENPKPYEVCDLNFTATELRLGLPGSEEVERQATSSVRNNKRASPDMAEEGGSKGGSNANNAPTAK